MKKILTQLVDFLIKKFELKPRFTETEINYRVEKNISSMQRIKLNKRNYNGESRTI